MYKAGNKQNAVSDNRLSTRNRRATLSYPIQKSMCSGGGAGGEEYTTGSRNSENEKKRIVAKALDGH